MWTVFEVAVNLFQGFLMIFFISRSIPEAKRSHWLIDLSFEIAIGAFLSLYLFFTIKISDGIVWCFPLAYCWVTRRGTWPQRIFWVVVLGTVFTAIASGMAAVYESIFQVTYEQLLQYSVQRIGLVIITNVADSIVLIMILHISRHDEKTLLPASAFFTFIVSLVLQIVIAEILFVYQIQQGANDTVFIIIDISILALVILTILLYELVSQSVFNRYQSEMALQVMELNQKHNTDIHMIYNEMLATQHDMRHRINAAESLLKQGNNVPEEKIHELLNNNTEQQNQFITGCVMVDAILTAKKAVMDEAGILFRYQPYPLQKLPIGEADFCVLVSNILDNAIEAIERIEHKEEEKPEISLSFARSWDMFYIRCENPMDPNTIHIRDSQFISSKKNARLHGFGTQYIKRLAENAGGQCQFTHDGDKFTVMIVLPDQDL